MIKMIKGGVTAAKGFCAASTAAGIKYQNRQDMAMLYSEVPCAVAGTFTTNLVKAAPVKWDQKIVYESKKAQAVVINAGIANACTGEEGMRYCRQTAEKVGELLPVPEDQVLVASTGVIGMQLPMERISEKNEDYDRFCEALRTVNEYLAKQMAGDGEGATALFEVKVIGAETKEQAKIISKSVITSNLTKAAIYGHDANWGRILCAMGYSGAQFDPEKVDLFFESAAGKMQIIKDGVALDYSEEEATKILSEPEVTAIADIKMGTEEATAWGCDLTYDYVKINADYRS